MAQGVVFGMGKHEWMNPVINNIFRMATISPTPKITDAELEKLAHDFMNDPAFAHIREDEKLWDAIAGEGLVGCEQELVRLMDCMPPAHADAPELSFGQINDLVHEIRP
jgi:hypothetical protein